MDSVLTRSVISTHHNRTDGQAARPFFAPVIQPKLTINQPNDVFEQEADTIAEKVMRMSDHDAAPAKVAPVVVQKKCSACEEEEKLQKKEEEESEEGLIHRKCAACEQEDKLVQRTPYTVQRKCAACEEEEKLQRKCAACEEELQLKASGAPAVAARPAAPSSVYQVLQSGGSPLDEGTRHFMESRFKQDFGHVQIHNDPLAHQSAKEINAKAYTHGKHIVFAPGEYQPHTPSGKQLLAHELVHVMQQGHGVVRREPKDIHVPDTEQTEEWKPVLGREFLWKNPDLRKIIYPQREDSLRAFLEIVKSLELSNLIEGSKDLPDEEIQKMIEKDKIALEVQIKELEDDKRSLQDYIKDEKAEIAGAEMLKQEREKELRALLKPGAEATKTRAAKIKIEATIKTLSQKIENAQNNLDWVIRKEKRAGKDLPKEKELWEKRKSDAIQSRDKLLSELETVKGQYDKLIGPLETTKEALVDEISGKKAEIKNAEARIKKITTLVSKSKTELAKITKLAGSIQKRKDKPGKDIPANEKSLLQQWRLKRYRDLLISMDHTALLVEVKKVFENQAARGFFPDWMQYAIIHFSGMRYASAHGTWEENPQELLFILKDIEIDHAVDENANKVRGEALLEMSSKEAQKIFSFEAVKKQLRGKDLAALEKLIPIAASLKEQYIELARAQDEARVKEASEKITTLEEEAETLLGEFSPAVRKKIIALREKDKQALITRFREKSKAKLKALSTAQVLTILKKMRDDGQIPDYAWDEITSFTELRIEMPADRLVPKKNKGLKDMSITPKVDPAEFTRWKNILKLWYKKSDSTAWRKGHAKTLNVSIVTSLVCDQIGSMVQHARGLEPAGGLRKNALFYYDLAKDAKTGPAADWNKDTVCPPEPPGPVFKKPSKLEDFPCGASIFWMDWSELEITSQYKTFYERKEAPLLKDIQRLVDKRKSLLKSDPKNELPKVEKDLAELNHKRKKMLEERSKIDLFKTPKEKSFVPDFSNLVSPFPEADLKIFDTQKVYKETQAGNQAIVDVEESGFEIKNGITRNGWTYSINEDRVELKSKKGTTKVSSVMRVQPNPFVCSQPGSKCDLEFSNKPNPNLVKQWLIWRHQATVLFVKPPSTIYTFDTSGRFNDTKISGLTVMERHLSSMTGTKNVFVGFTPGKNKDLTPFLEDAKIFSADTNVPASEPAKDNSTIEE